MKPFRRVLIVQPYGIGDLLFITPVFRALRLLPGIERVDLILGSRTRAVVENNPHVDELIEIDKDFLHGQSAIQNLLFWKDLAFKIRNRRYDLLLDYSLRMEYSLMGLFLWGIPVRAAFDYKRRGFFATHRIPIKDGFHSKHVTDYCCDLAEKAGIPVENRFLEFYLTDAERIKAAETIQARSGRLMHRYLAVSPGGGESWGADAHFKRWPMPYFVGFSRDLYESHELDGIVLLGSPGEKKLCEEFQRLANFPVLNLAGEISLIESAAILEKAVMLLANDGGMVHLARSLEVPVTAFYGPVDPAVYGPYPVSGQSLAIIKKDLECRPCYRAFRYNSACIGRECLQALSPDEALKEFSESLLSQNVPFRK